MKIRNALDEMRESDRIKRLEVKITWPNGRVQEKLDPHSAGLTWQHANQGHDKIYEGCYACACEDAY